MVNEQRIIASRLFLRWGIFPGMAAITAFAVALSWILTFSSAWLIGFPREFWLLLLLIATAVPSLVAPVASYVVLQLLKELQVANQIAERLTSLDELTASYNRRYFLDAAERALAESVRYGLPLSLAMLDIDHFKEINDSQGHAAGDEVLRELARLCRQQLRQADIFSRLGGDEFAVLLPGTDHAAALIVAERLRHTLAEGNFPAAAGKQVTVSLGIATRTADVTTLEPLLALADKALYTAKHAGRNCVRG